LQKSSTPDAAHGPGGHLSEAQDQPAGYISNIKYTRICLKNLKIDCCNQVWAAGITYIPMSRGFMYLVAVMDWHNRKVLSWRISNISGSDFCVEALQEVISPYGKPEIFNYDQRAQFTSDAFTSLLMDHEINISMDSRGRVQNNIIIERLW